MSAANEIVTEAVQTLNDLASAFAAGQRAEARERTALAERAAREQLQRRASMTPEQAAAKYKEFEADKEFMAKYLAGDVAATQQMDDVIARKAEGPANVDSLLNGTAGSGYFEGAPVLDVQAWIEDARTLGISEESLRHTLEGRSVPAADHDAARRLKERLFMDPEWVKKYLAKDPAAMQQVDLIGRILIAPIADAA